ncbi:sigma-70 family RNA polymerase sigma factor [Planomicrobium sp. CPCC 101079]|uniref:sigma-70 family RNA polymerase sigma factor n=1 Tax=Planomicrobium sp. CPCC 101079 TaxID=2599618 RepID=UPI0011B78BFF|nr:sigma-70 family RNA polymerase sigma factor [Planomicrobium sp. CPCC 101079]TWT05887.1 sigma-70 family RNA polymerase sigma factor [Planomicrobium sp. CPCC 101079]
MKYEELFAYAMTGEKAAYSEWCSLRHLPIARFGYQNGIAVCQLQKFQLDVFRQFYNKLPAAFSEEREAEAVLFQISICQMEDFKEGEETSAGDQVMRFEEDKECHRNIQLLSKNLRILFTLFYFHKKSLKELALLIGETEAACEAGIAEAFKRVQEGLQLDNREILEKRLEFLGKSYKRFMPPFNEMELFAEREVPVESVELELIETRAPIKKGTVAMIGVTSLFLIGVVGASFATNDNEIETAAAVAEDGPIDSRTVRAWKVEYEKIKKASPDQLGLKPEVYAELEYVQRADEKMERLLQKRTIRRYENDPELLRDRVEKVMLEIQTPKGMYDVLVSGSMMSSESADFLQSYALKTKELMTLADAVLLKHKDALSEAFRHGEFSAESIRAHKDQYPEEVGVLVDSLDDSMLLIAPHPKETKFLARRNMELLYGNDLLLQDMFGYQYLSFLENEPYFDGVDLLLPIDVISFHLAQIERFLVDTAQTPDEVYGEFEFIFQHAFWLLLKGSETNPVFNANGVVHKEYQTAWKNLVTNTANPLIYLMLPIINEMEASGWKKSAHYDALAYSDITQALEMEKNGELAAKLPNGNVSIDAAFVDMQDFSYDQTEEIYKRFSATHDINNLKGLQPLDVLFLYHYANTRKDPKTMWHLLAEDKFKPSLENYIKGWKQQPDLTKEALWIEIYEESVYRVKEELHTEPQIQYRSQEATVPPAPVLVTKSDNIWLVKNQMFETYSMEEEADAFKDKIALLYKEFSASQGQEIVEAASPGEIAGLFLQAAEQGDFETMYALIEEPSKQGSLESFRQQVANRNLPAFTTLKALSFTVDTYDYQDNQKRGWVQLDNGSSTEDTYELHEFAMVETPEGWRMGDINIY